MRTLTRLKRPSLTVVALAASLAVGCGPKNTDDNSSSSSSSSGDVGSSSAASAGMSSSRRPSSSGGPSSGATSGAATSAAGGSSSGSATSTIADSSSTGATSTIADSSSTGATSTVADSSSNGATSTIADSSSNGATSTIADSSSNGATSTAAGSSSNGATSAVPSSSSVAIPTYTVGGTITGLATNNLSLTNNGADTLAVSSGATSFVFVTALNNAQGYAVAIAHQPDNTTCVVNSGSGTIAGANVTNVSIVCTFDSYPVGGTLAGLTEAGLGLSNNGGTLTPAANDTTFTFPSQPYMSNYQVGVVTQPLGLTCSVLAASGMVMGPVTDVSVACSPNSYTVGGNVTGLAATETVTLQFNGGTGLPLLGDGPYAFSNVVHNTAYSVTATSPAFKSCTVANATGTVRGANVTNVDVTCVSTTVCGDNVVEGAETCDDGNTTAGDGCSAVCLNEAGFFQEREPNEDGTPSVGGTLTQGNDFSIANANGPFSGNITILAAFAVAGDEDVFAVTNTQTGTAIFTAETFAGGAGLCSGGVDTVIAVRDATGTQLALDDEGGVNSCSRLTFTVPVGGTVYLHLSFWGDDTAVPAYSLVLTADGYCGDNVKQGLEECDPPGTAVCDATCHRIPSCGDNVVDPGEQCDDGNIVPGDGCSATCQFEVVCGNSVLQGSESCDDGNTTAGDGCDATCTLEPGFFQESEPNDDGTLSTGSDFLASAANGPFVIGPPVKILGSIVASDDDAFKFDNAFTGSALVRFETFPSDGSVCPSSSNMDTLLEVFDAAGTSVAIDDDTSAGWCSVLEVTVPAGSSVYAVVSHSNGSSVVPHYRLVATLVRSCGNNTVETGEQCDPPAAGLCDNTCQRIPVCGDTFIDGTEQCDDGNVANNDGCSSTCQLEELCGNGILNAGEQCDDGNAVNGDGCSFTTVPKCQVEAGHFFETEPNDDGTPATGTSDFLVSAANGPITSSVIIHGAIRVAGDDDVFAITNPTASPINARFDVYNPALGVGVSCGTTTDTDLNIRDAAGTSLARNDDRVSGDWCSGMNYTIPAGATVYAHLIELGDNAAIAGYLFRVALPVCGNNIVELGEECEPAGTATCDATCQRVPLCGDGFVDAPETCDDTNPNSGDGCSATCTVEATHYCAGTPSVCWAKPTTVPLACTDMTGSTTLTATGDDVVSATTALPFAYTLYGTPVTHFATSTNGFVGLLTSATGTVSSSFSNSSTMPNTATPNGILAPFWDDLGLTGTGVRYLVTGTAPTRRLTIEWNASTFTQVATLLFQVQVNEGGMVQYHYCSSTGDATRAGGSSATIGAENLTGTIGYARGINTAGTVTPGTTALQWDVH